MTTILKYLKQPSTWRGIIAVAAAFGLSLSPDQTAAIVTAGLAAIGLVEAFRDEDNPKAG